MTEEALTQPEKKIVYRIYEWSENIADWKGVAGFRDEAEALKLYADLLKYGHKIKLTKVTTQDLLIKGE